jgi:thiaminase
MDALALFSRHYSILESFLKHKFFSDVHSGTLSTGQLALLLTQDGHYLTAFADRLDDLSGLIAHNSSRLMLKRHAEETRELSRGAVDFVGTMLGCPHILDQPARPMTRAYMNHLSLSVRLGLLQGLASVLPCYFFYPHFVKTLRQEGVQSSAVWAWINWLPSPTATQLWAAEITSVCEFAEGKASRDDLDRLFAQSAQHEIRFLDMIISDSA